MGELRTRKRGKTWEWSFEGAKIDGKRKPISKGGYRTKAEALAAGTQAKAEYDNVGRHFVPSEMSVADYMKYWHTNYALSNCNHSTCEEYEGLIRNHINPAFGKYRLAALTPDVIQVWVDQKKLKGYAKNTISNILSCLRNSLDYAVQPCQFIKQNPCDYVKIGRMPVDQDRKAHTEYVCNKEDFSKILERFGPDTNHYLSLMIGYHCGTRIAESYGFDLLTDVDFKNHTITVNQQLAKEKKQWFYRPPKYDSYRTIDIDPFFEGLLKDEIKRRKLNRLRYGQYFTVTYLMPDNSIFQAPATVLVPTGKEIMPICACENGELLTPESFKYCARVIHYELGNMLFHYHCLRHTHGTILAENGAQPKTVMERLGHKDIVTTIKRYTFNTDKMKSDALKIFMEAI